MDSNALPKGHIIGWAPPPTSTAASGSNEIKPLSKSAKKNAKRKEKREKEKSDTVPDNWDDEEQEKPSSNASAIKGTGASENASSTPAKPSSDASKTAGSDATDALATELEKLDVK
jgi:partner of Y14 and mago protein